MITRIRVFVLSISFLGVLALLLPLSAGAQSPHLKGYERSQGQKITVSDPLGWPVSLQTSSYNNASLESLPGMAVIRVQPYNPWWHFYGGIPKDTTATVSGLPVNTDLQVYTHGYREHEVKHTDEKGTLTFSFPSKPGTQFIIRAKPSTKHIALDPLFGPPGGDCASIGTWNITATTCTLSTDVHDTIAIEDDGITLDGNKKTVTGSGDGVYTDKSNVTVKNITIANVGRGMVFDNTAFLFAPIGGALTDATLNDNTSQVIAQDVANVSTNRVTINRGSTAVRLTDQGGYQLFTTTMSGSALGINFDHSRGAVARHVTIQNSSTGMTGNDSGGVAMTQDNFISNAVDLGPFSGTLTLSGIDRGNFWSKNTACIQCLRRAVYRQTMAFAPAEAIMLKLSAALVARLP